MQKFDTLPAIFQMVSPASSVSPDGAKNEVASIVQRQLLEVLFEGPGGGTYTSDQLIEQLASKTKSATAEQGNEFRRIVSVLGANRVLTTQAGAMTWPYLAWDTVGRKPVNVTSTRQLFGKSVNSVDDITKPFSIVTVNSPMVSPQRRDAEKAELFLNATPDTVINRCVPYIELEFGFNRPGDGTARTQLQATSLMKFLLGADATDFARGTADRAMIDARRLFDPQSGNEYSTAGMELFTAPQTLVNLEPSSQQNRYVPVIDPMRPLASLQSVTIDVKPTVGVYSFKKASVQFKLHDRSRLTEIADLIKPTVYTQSTVWLTYGWRHPFEPDNPHAAFINDNMLRREAYGVYNSQFSFDANGQVDITLELYTKSAAEVKTVKISQNLKQYNDRLTELKQVAEQINEYRSTLNLAEPRPGGVELRGVLLLDAAGQGALPDFAVKGKKDDILSAIKSLSMNLKKGAFDQPTAEKLIASLKQLYVGSGKSGGTYAEVARGLQSAVAAQFEEARTGLDPYLMFAEKNEARKRETGSSVDHPFLSVLKDQLAAQGKQRAVRRQYASFAKVFSVFVANSIMTIPGIDEIQAVFYQLNGLAGDARETNIAEFPVDLTVFEDAYREDIERKGSDSFTIEEFLQLLIRCQFDDMRNAAYGFASYFEPYKPGGSQTLKKGQDALYQAAIDNIARGKGAFQKPQLEVFMETVFAAGSGEGASLDLLKAFSSANSEGSVNRDSSEAADTFKRILRIHVYDKALNPYEASTDALDGKQGSGGATPNLTNKQVKDYVQRNVPTITYGTSASMVMSAEVSTKNDPLLVAAQLTGLNTSKTNTMSPRGSGSGGLPLRVLPGSLSMTTMGCPLLNYAQMWFFDASTGTSLDNLYGVTGITHSFTPGRFTSQMTMGFFDAYGRFESDGNALEAIARYTKVSS